MVPSEPGLGDVTQLLEAYVDRVDFELRARAFTAAQLVGRELDFLHRSRLASALRGMQGAVTQRFDVARWTCFLHHIIHQFITFADGLLLITGCQIRGISTTDSWLRSQL